jgi:hypothetical protein
MTEEIIIEDATVAEVPYGDMYLKFANEAEAMAALYTSHPEVVDEEGNVSAEAYVTPIYDMSIDVIGVIYNTDNTDPENPVVTPMDGWHVNTRGQMPEAMRQYAVIPTNPRRVWA